MLPLLTATVTWSVSFGIVVVIVITTIDQSTAFSFTPSLAAAPATFWPQIQQTRRPFLTESFLRTTGMATRMKSLSSSSSSPPPPLFRRDDWIVSSLGGDGDRDNLTSPSKDSTTTTRRTKLFLHFDINETILLGDDAGGDTRQESVQKMIAKSAFVRMPATVIGNGWEEGPSSSSTAWERTHELEPTHWWDGQAILPAADTSSMSSTTATLSSLLPAAPPPKLYTGWDWPEGCCPYYRTKFKKYSKDFVLGDQPGGHGRIYKPLLIACEDALSSLSTTTPSGAGGDNQQHPSPPANHILPAFYDTLQYLTQEHYNRKQKTQEQKDLQASSSSSSSSSFMIVFRTFGSDLDEICDAVTTFANGNHPDYPNVHCPQLCFSHDNLYQGRWIEVEMDHDEDGSNSSSKSKTGKKAVYQLWTRDETQLVASGDRGVLDFLKTKNHESLCIGIRDDYQYWTKKNNNPAAGKPIWVPYVDDSDNDDDDDNVFDHHLLFDDNIHNLPHDGIACVRQQQDDGSYISVDGSIMHTPEMGYQGVHMIRVPTIEPVLNPKWYIEQIKNAQTRLQRKLRQQQMSSDHSWE